MDPSDTFVGTTENENNNDNGKIHATSHMAGPKSKKENIPHMLEWDEWDKMEYNGDIGHEILEPNHPIENISPEQPKVKKTHPEINKTQEENPMELG